MKFTVVEPVIVNGEWDLVEYEEERNFPKSEGRHDDLCVVCAFPSYPECRRWCPNDKIISERKANQSRE